MKLVNHGFDHVEYSLFHVDKWAPVWDRMGFERLGERRLSDQGTRSVLYGQGFVRILLTECNSDKGGSATKEFLSKHGEGICVLALEVDNATAAFEETTKKGARPALEPVTYQADEGTVIRSEVWTPGDVRYAFIERKAPKGLKAPALFDRNLVAKQLESPSPLGIKVIDHLTNNVDMGQMKAWVQWYKDIFDFTVTRHFQISTGRTGLISDVVESKDGRIKVPINEATEPESQVQEFVERFKGAGVQHLAFLTTDLVETVGQLRKKDFKFLGVPSTYYEQVPSRVPGLTEDLRVLESLQILADGEGKDGYLLQLFSEEMLGPFFFEFIQRKGNRGFGEGNFKALFEAIEQDQRRRGVLK